jgi:hypothetical protein
MFTADNIPAERVTIIDSGEGSYADRYTVIIDGDLDCVLTMSARPNHPLGVCMHADASSQWLAEEQEAGHEIELGELPEACRRMIARDLNMIELEERERAARQA